MEFDDSGTDSSRSIDAGRDLSGSQRGTEVLPVEAAYRSTHFGQYDDTRGEVPKETRFVGAPGIQPEAVPIKIVETVTTDVLGISPDAQVVYLRFQREGAVEKKYIPIEALRNAGMVNPAANEQYEFRVIESLGGYFGRFVRKVRPMPVVSESEIPLTPSVEALERYLRENPPPEGGH
ncbi:MAG: hypothetical protein AAB320_04380 [Elusimicrobiota bacterium]